MTGTLWVLPLVIIGLWSIDRWIRRGEPLEIGATGAFEIGSFLLLVLVILGRESLGLGADSPGLDPVLAGALLLQLAIRLWTLVPRLARVLESEPDGPPPWPFLLLPLLVYMAIVPWSGAQREPDGDEPHYLLIAHSLAYDLDTDLANNYAEEDSLTFLS